MYQFVAWSKANKMSIYLVNDFHKYHHNEWMTQLFLAFVVGDTSSLFLFGDLQLENSVLS